MRLLNEPAIQQRRQLAINHPAQTSYITAARRRHAGLYNRLSALADPPLTHAMPPAAAAAAAASKI